MYQVDQNTVALLHFDDQANPFKDECGTIWSALSANPEISNTEHRIGNGSLFIPKGSRIHSNANPQFAFGNGDYTIDFWVKGISLRVSDIYKCAYFVSSVYESKGSGVEIRSYVAAQGSNHFGTANSVLAYFDENAQIENNKWTHIALVRHDDTMLVFFQGKLICTASGLSKIPVQNNVFAIGVGCLDKYPSPVAYHMDELRISNCARWTEDFDPEQPTEPIVPTDPTDPTTPIDPPDSGILRVALLDSSEHEYQLTSTEIKGFVEWFNSTDDPKTPSYCVEKSIGTKKSKEYLSFNKIISFEVK